ncbi:MAG: caspase family protein [Hylemonella sp.]|nr:caspase family protein [Hylemonella sp.]
MMWAALAACVSSPAWAQNAGNWGGLPKRPFLAIDGQAHSDEASYIVLTPDDRRAVTAAYDGSVRVWDVQTGEMLQRFFLPRGAPISNLLRGLAMAPDGQRIAVTGNNMRRAIVILSLQTGRIERVITGTENSSILAWSQDGRFLAAGKPGVRQGVSVYSAADGKEVFRDADFPSAVTGLEFRADGAFYAASWDNRGQTIVRLYKPDAGSFREAARKTPRWGDYRSHWDAAGKTILLGAHTRLDGETLEEVTHALNRSGMPPNVFFSRVVQAPEGGQFFGTTWSLHSGQGFLRRWAGAHIVDKTDQLRLPDAKVTDFAVTRKGEVVYLTEQGTVAMVDADFKLAWRVAADVADFQRRSQALKVTESGLVYLPVPGDDGKRDVAFNLAEPGYTSAQRLKVSWKEPSTSGRGVGVLAWEGTANATVNGAPLPLVGKTERSLSVAAHSTDGHVAVGSNWERLYKISGKGEQLWMKYLGSDVLAVNHIESRDLVVAATANGMLWVFRWSTGEQVMSYYLQPASKRWIAISSQGYYEASVGAEDSAGWILNPTAARAADFMPMSRFRGTLRLEGLAGKAWSLRSEREAVEGLKPQLAPAQPVPVTATAPMPVAPIAATTPAPAMAVAAPPAPPIAPEGAAVQPAPETLVMSASAVSLEALPPRIEIVAPGYQVRSDTRQISIRFRVISAPEAPVTQVRTLLASGSSAQRNLAVGARAQDNGEREVTLEIPPEDTDIRLIAENRYGASVPTVIRVSYTGPRPGSGQGDLYVLAAGVSRYDNPDYNLGLAAKDARDFVETLRKQRGAQYGEVHVRQLLDQEASRPALEAGLEWLRLSMKPRDTAIVFLAGHGFNDGPTYYFMTRDANLQNLSQTALPFTALRSTLTALQGRVMLFVDTCHSGNVIGRMTTRQARDSTSAVNEMASSENGLVVFASSTGGQFSQENAEWGNGAFTKAVVEGLQGAADFKKRGRITYKGLDAYVSDRVDELTRGEQTPVTPVLAGVPDFVIALFRR